MKITQKVQLFFMLKVHLLKTIQGQISDTGGLMEWGTFVYRYRGGREYVERVLKCNCQMTDYRNHVKTSLYANQTEPCKHVSITNVHNVMPCFVKHDNCFRLFVFRVNFVCLIDFEALIYFTPLAYNIFSLLSKQMPV